jgi:alkanesulfonate monooxygenase
MCSQPIIPVPMTPYLTGFTGARYPGCCQTRPGSAFERPAELSWFAALCDDDYRHLGVPDPLLESSWEHCRDICLSAEVNGFDNILLPSGYALGIDSLAFASAVASQLDRLKLLIAVRCGEVWPPQLARQLATIDQMLPRPAGAPSRLTVNIISSDLPGTALESEPRYQRTREVIEILRTLLSGDSVDHHSEFYDIEVDVPRICEGPPPPFYFGGMSEPAKRLAAESADVYLMWPDTMPAVEATVAEMTERAQAVGRELRFGYRCHVVVRETESAARAAAAELLSSLDAPTGDAIRGRSIDTASAGVARQSELRDGADGDGYVEDHLWTGIGRARSGCGAAIVGDPDQVATMLDRYRLLGVDHFILSGYPHLEEVDHFARLVSPLWAQ